MSSVEIIVGDRWKEDVRYIDSLRPRRPADSSLDLLELRDIIDIVVDGTNLTASIPEEAIFGLVESMLAALVRLVDETSRKAIIEFHHEPWELVLLPDGDVLKLSLYSIDRRRCVVVRDRPVNARAFIDAICAVAEQMLTDLFGVSERFSSHRQVRHISQSLARLKRTPRIRFSAPYVTDMDGDGTHVASTSNAQGLTVGYRFDAADPGLLNYRGEHVFDLHALLFDGVLEAEFGAQSLVLAKHFPFLAICALMDRTRQLFNRLESHPDTPFALDDEWGGLNLSVHGNPKTWTLRARPGDDGEWWEHCLAPSACLDTLVSLAELFLNDLLRINPHLTVNQRFADMEEEAEKLRRWHHDLCGNNVYHERPEDYLRRLADVEPTARPQPGPAQFPWPLRSVHTLFPQRSWNLWSKRVDFASLTVTDTSLLAPTRSALRCLHPATGDEQWRYGFQHPLRHDRSMALGGDQIVVADPGGNLVVLDRNTGGLTARYQTESSWKHLVGAAHYDSQDLMVVARHDGVIAAFELADASRRWRHGSGPGKLESLLFHGPLVCAQSCEGVMTALNPCTGETVWKVRLGGTPEQAAAIHQGRIYAITHDPLHRGSTLYALYPFTGRTVWQLRLSGYASGPPSFVDQWMLLPLEKHGQLTMAGIDLEAVDPRINWQLELSSAGFDRPTPVSPVRLDGQWHGLVRTDRAELTCFRVCDGAVRWRVIPAKETLLLHGNLPLYRVRDAVVLVSETVDLRHVDTGELLHTFDVGTPPEFGFLTPAFNLILAGRATGDDDTDQITAYRIDHFLALVE